MGIYNNILKITKMRINSIILISTILALTSARFLKFDTGKFLRLSVASEGQMSQLTGQMQECVNAFNYGLQYLPQIQEWRQQGNQDTDITTSPQWTPIRDRIVADCSDIDMNLDGSTVQRNQLTSFAAIMHNWTHTMIFLGFERNPEALDHYVKNYGGVDMYIVKNEQNKFNVQQYLGRIANAINITNSVLRNGSSDMQNKPIKAPTVKTCLLLLNADTMPSVQENFFESEWLGYERIDGKSFLESNAFRWWALEITQACNGLEWKSLLKAFSTLIWQRMDRLINGSGLSERAIQEFGRCKGYWPIGYPSDQTTSDVMPVLIDIAGYYDRVAEFQDALELPENVANQQNTYMCRPDWQPKNYIFEP